MDEEFLVDHSRTKTIRQMSEEALDAAIETGKDSTFIDEMEEQFEERGYLTERQRKVLWEIANQ